MAILVKTAVFLLGTILCVQMVAALYGVLDLKDRFRTAYPVVCRRILTWGALTAACCWLLTRSLRSVFLWGILAYVLLYVVIFGMFQLVFMRNAKSMKIQ